ncbi:MAG: hypothetical protein WAU91_23105 [Desulfatitalea sp.]
MRLNNQNTLVGLFALFISALLCSPEVLAGKRVEEVVIESSESLFQSLIADQDPKLKPLLAQWMDYIESASTYSNDNYIEAIHILQKEYSDLLVQYEQCLNSAKELRKNYDPAWLERFLEYFGVAYLKDKEESVHHNLGMIIGGAQENCCGTILERLLFKETVLYGAYRDYVNMFLNFYKKQPPAVRGKLESRKEAAKNFLELIDRISVVKMTLAGGLHRRQLSELKARNVDKAIYEYFKNNPPGCDIDPFKAIEDFRKSIRSQ